MKRDISLLFELATLRNVPRNWVQIVGRDVDNLAEHSLRTIILSLLIAKREKADLGRVMLLALVHDLPESRTLILPIKTNHILIKLKKRL